ncbi:MAG: Pvc16 family protein [Ilumatobacteraceae bacterium]
MLDHVDECLERFLRSAVPLSARDVDVSFEAPDREWAGKLSTRPTVNLFLWDIRRSTDRARAGLETYQEDGQTKRRLALPRIELRYLVTTWTAEHADARALMGGLLRTLLGHSEIPAHYVTEPLDRLSPLTLTMPRGSDAHIDVFKALDGQLKAALDIVITTDVDTRLGQSTAAPPAEIGITIADSTAPGRQSRTRRVAGHVTVAGAAGCGVRTPRGHTVVDSTGRFLVAAQPGDIVTVDLDPPLSAVVPDQGGVVLG